MLIGSSVYYLTKVRRKVPAKSRLESSDVAETFYPDEVSENIAEDGVKTRTIVRTRLKTTTVVKREIPEQASPNAELSDGWGSFLYFWLMLGAELTPVIVLAVFGVNIIIVLIYFGIFPIVGVFSGYLFRRFRTPKLARDVESIIRHGMTTGFHLGKDGVFRIIGGRRGATGRIHFPNMEIYGDVNNEATYPLAGAGTCMIIKSDMDTPVQPNFIVAAQDMINNSEQIGAKGVPKDARKIMSILVDMKQREDKLDEYQKVMEDIERKSITLESYLYEHYRPLLFKDGTNLNTEELEKMKQNFNSYIANNGARIKKERQELGKAKINVAEKNLEIEYERDIKGFVIGAHLIRHTVLNLSGIRKLWPSGGGAEDAFTSTESAKLADRKMRGESSWKDFMRWFGPMMILIGFGIMVYLIVNSIH